MRTVGKNIESPSDSYSASDSGYSKSQANWDHQHKLFGAWEACTISSGTGIIRVCKTTDLALFELELENANGNNLGILPVEFRPSFFQPVMGYNETSGGSLKLIQYWLYPTGEIKGVRSGAFHGLESFWACYGALYRVN